MSGMYPILWAMKHAPCADVTEQAVLIQMADSADEDGQNAYLSKPTIAGRIPGEVDEETVRKKWRAMEKRGLIRPDRTPPPPRYLKIPKNRRTYRWELCIPYSWWSDAQREQVQRNREDRGLEPLTPESRPDLAPAPAPKSRSDKGKPRPHRRKKTQDTPPAAGANESGPSAEGSGANESGPQGPMTVGPRGHYEWPNPPLVDPPGGPSSPPAPPVADTTGATPEAGGEDETQDHTHDAQAIVDSAVSRWASGHKAPTPRDRQRLIERVAAELANGGTEAVITHELTRDLGNAQSAVSVVMGHRTRTPGWGVPCDPRPDPLQYVPKGPLPQWCRICSEQTRLVAGQRADGSERLYRCPRCHPEAEPADCPTQPEIETAPVCPDHPAQPWIDCPECAEREQQRKDAAAAAGAQGAAAARGHMGLDPA